MDIESFRTYCIGLKGSTEDIKWEDQLCFMVEQKIYVMCSLGAPHSFSFKVSPEDFDQLVARNGLKQAPYLARGQWVFSASLEVLPDEELKQRIAESRELILSKLSKKVREKYS